MASLRYKVAVVHGDLSPVQGRHEARQQLSAHVLDRLNAHRVVATFRSEDAVPLFDAGERIDGRQRIGTTTALAKAEALAAEWNADEAR